MVRSSGVPFSRASRGKADEATGDRNTRQAEIVVETDIEIIFTCAAVEVIRTDVLFMNVCSPASNRRSGSWIVVAKKRGVNGSTATRHTQA